MDDLETKLAEYKPNPVYTGLRAIYECGKPVTSALYETAKTIALIPIAITLGYIFGALPNEMRLKLIDIADDEKLNKNELNKKLYHLNTITNLAAGLFVAAFYRIYHMDHELRFSESLLFFAGINEFMISCGRTFLSKKTPGHPLLTIPYHIVKKLPQQYAAQEQKLIEEHNSKIIAAENQLLLEDKTGSLSHPAEIENQGMLSLPKYTSGISYDDEEHY